MRKWLVNLSNGCMLDNAFVYYYKGKNEGYNLIESKETLGHYQVYF